jgi:hypothetical protein
VRGQQHRAALGDQFADQVAHLEDARGIKPVHRLVEDQQLGVGQQAARDAEPLAHPERVRLDAVVAAGGEADARQCAVDPRARITAARRRVDLQVLAAAEMRVKSAALR